VSERGLPIADSATACPFVAFEDDRDERATVPDHRHRCYADVRPSPRALAHQEAYCLSSSFPVCPTFQDWARRESARARADAQAREDADAADRAAGPAAGAGAAAAGAAGAAGLAAGAAGLAAGGASGAADHAGDAVAETFDRDVRPVVAGSDDADDDDELGSTDTRLGDDEGEPRRNPPRDWSAPPPWLASSEAARAHNASPPDFLARRGAEPGQGLAGSAADRLAGGSPVQSSSSPAAAWREPEADDEHLSGRGAPPPRRPRAYDQHLGGPSSGPDWERPRRYEAYPTIKTRVGMPAIPRIAVLAALIALAALAFFFLPAILGLGNKSGPGGASPSASVAPSVSTEPTTAPAATPILYTIKKNETLSKIATAHGITLQQLLDANPTIKNPNKIVEGQQITIPTPQSSVPDEFGPSGSPAAS
jgi:LysM repeat protein